MTTVNDEMIEGVIDGTLQPTVVNPNDYDHTHRWVHPWALCNEYGCFAIVYASTEQDAIDEAADAGMFDGWMIMLEDEADEEDSAYLRAGNEGTLYHVGDYFKAVQLPNKQYGRPSIYVCPECKGEDGHSATCDSDLRAPRIKYRLAVPFHPMNTAEVQASLLLRFAPKKETD